MARVSTFIYAEESHNEVNPKGQRMNIVNPLLIFSPKYLPGQFSFSVAIGILEVDYSQTHVFRYLLRGPKSEREPIVDTGNVPIPSQLNPRNLPLEMQGIFIGFDLRNIDLEDEGKYTSEAFIDGVSLGLYPISIKGMNSDAHQSTVGPGVAK